jgi:hypothetical protein
MAAVRDYFAMLKAELGGEPYNKAAHRRALIGHLRGRSNGSVERKHQNISAVLMQLGLPYITGYKPLGNYQTLLAHEVERFIGRSRDILDAARADVERPAEPPAVDDYLSALVDAPSEDAFVPGVLLETTSRLEKRRRPRTNYLETESRNRSLGLAGEEFVLAYERQRLLQAGKRVLADKIEHVSQTQGDSAGFDIRSFDSRGVELFIEVKTTRYGVLTPFFVSSNELGFSRAKRDSYSLYRVFEFRERPRLFVLPGAVDERCALYPQVYRAWPPQAV